MDKDKILKGKSPKEIKKEFDKLFKNLFNDKLEMDSVKAFNLISGIVKLIPNFEKQDFARNIINEIVIWCSNNGYDAIGILEFSKTDLIKNFNEICDDCDGCDIEDDEEGDTENNIEDDLKNENNNENKT
jgi:hypothetical protein